MKKYFILFAIAVILVALFLTSPYAFSSPSAEDSATAVDSAQTTDQTASSDAQQESVPLEEATYAPTHTLAFPHIPEETERSFATLNAWMMNYQPFDLNITLPETWSVVEESIVLTVRPIIGVDHYYLYEGDVFVGTISFGDLAIAWEEYPVSLEGRVTFGSYMEELFVMTGFYNPYLDGEPTNKWQNYQMVAQTATSEAGVAEIQYVPFSFGAVETDPAVLATQTQESIGIVAYDQEIGTYIAITFEQGVMDMETAKEIAASVFFTPAPDALSVVGEYIERYNQTLAEEQSPYQVDLTSLTMQSEESGEWVYYIDATMRGSGVADQDVTFEFSKGDTGWAITNVLLVE